MILIPIVCFLTLIEFLIIISSDNDSFYLRHKKSFPTISTISSLVGEYFLFDI